VLQIGPFKISKLDVSVFCITLILGISMFYDGFIVRPLVIALGSNGSVLEKTESSALVLCLIYLSKLAITIKLTHAREVQGKPPLPKLFYDILTFVGFFLGLILIFVFILEKDITAILATGGFGIMLVGIALRDLMLAAFTGIILNSEKPFQIGDLISINGNNLGTVKNMSWRTTTLDSPTGLIIIPNLQLANSVITNYAKPDKNTRCTLAFLVDYDVPIQMVERIVNGAILTNQNIKLSESPTVFAKQMDKDGVIYDVRFGISYYRDVAYSENEAIRSILSQFIALGIRVSYPKQESLSADSRITPNEWHVELVKLLSKNLHFSKLSADDLQVVATHFQSVEIPTGTELTTAGVANQNLYLVCSGLVQQMTHVDANGIVQAKWVKPGEVVGLSAIRVQELEPVTFKACSGVSAYALSSPGWEALQAAHPSVAWRLQTISTTQA